MDELQLVEPVSLAWVGCGRLAQHNDQRRGVRNLKTLHMFPFFMNYACDVSVGELMNCYRCFLTLLLLFGMSLHFTQY